MSGKQAHFNAPNAKCPANDDTEKRLFEQVEAARKATTADITAIAGYSHAFDEDTEKLAAPRFAPKDDSGRKAVAGQGAGRDRKRERKRKQFHVAPRRAFQGRGNTLGGNGNYSAHS